MKMGLMIGIMMIMMISGVYSLNIGGSNSNGIKVSLDTASSALTGNGTCQCNNTIINNTLNVTNYYNTYNINGTVNPFDQSLNRSDNVIHKSFSASNILAANLSDLSSEIVINGTFDLNYTPFTKNTAWTYDNTNHAMNKSIVFSGSLFYNFTQQGYTFEIGKYYILSFTIFNIYAYVDLIPSIAGNTLQRINYNSSYTYQYIFKAKTQDILQLNAQGTSKFELDNVSVKQIYSGEINAASNITALNIFANNIVTIGSENLTKLHCSNITGSNVNLCNITTSSGSTGNPFNQNLNTTDKVTFDTATVSNLNITGASGITTFRAGNVFGRWNLWDLNSVYTWVRNSTNTFWEGRFSTQGLYIGNISYGADYTFATFDCEHHTILGTEPYCIMNISTSNPGGSAFLINQPIVSISDSQSAIALANNNLSKLLYMQLDTDTGNLNILQWNNDAPSDPILWNFLVETTLTNLKNVQIQPVVTNGYTQKVVCYLDDGYLGHCDNQPDESGLCDCQPNE
jgi:hypothetical protein